MSDSREFKMKVADELERGDEALQSGDQSAADLDQTHADSDQTYADSDQSAADADQDASNTDQELADRDQHDSDIDQAVADSERRRRRFVSSPEETEALEASRAERDMTTDDRARTSAARARSTGRRLLTAEARDEVAGARDLTAAVRDRNAQARDKAADARDRAAEARGLHAAEAHDVDEAVGTLHTIRVSGASTRKQSAQERAAAAEDRTAAAVDRQHAAADRGDAGLDELTGVFRRGTGEFALVHEIERSRRAGHPLILLVIDIDGLKLVNDHDGHAAGDTLLRAVSTAITVTLRSYDVTVRWGGDEFVCALPDMTKVAATDRVSQIKRELEVLHPGATICAGLAELRVDDSLESLVARADADLYRAKASRGTASETSREPGRG
ncbi:diguanylate cyclase, partial [Gaiella sp.]|uniref:GGDEF domain-containing protein n=1 Tax=Gaiella sp. TaxID=2663207 RepID=UPI003983AC57